MANTKTDILPCGNFLWINGLNYLFLIKQLVLWTTFVDVHDHAHIFNK